MSGPYAESPTETAAGNPQKTADKNKSASYAKTNCFRHGTTACFASGMEAGMHTVLVLTGSTTREEADRHPYRASRVLESVADLIPELTAAEQS